MCVCIYECRGQKHGFPGTRVTCGCEPLLWMLGIEFRSSGRQCVLQYLKANMEAYACNSSSSEAGIVKASLDYIVSQTLSVATTITPNTQNTNFEMMLKYVRGKYMLGFL